MLVKKILETGEVNYSSAPKRLLKRPWSNLHH